MAGLENNIENAIRRRNHEGQIDHELIRGLVLRDVFNPVEVAYQRPLFNFEEIDQDEAELNFRFKKEDIPRLVQALRLPNEFRTTSGHVSSGIEGLCILLRRLAYPNRLTDLEGYFHRSKAALSEISNYVNRHICDNFRHLLDDLTNLDWLDYNRQTQYAQAISAKGAAVQNCWGFIDGTARAICRPTTDQEEYYSGHKHFHCVKFQAVVCPDGITVSLMGAFPGRRHDAGIFRESGLYNQLEQKSRHPDGTTFVLFGDQAYGIRELLLCPFPGQGVNDAERNFNASMSVVRQAVEWSFQKTIMLFAFVDFKKNQKLLLQDVQEMYKTATILTNCHSCIYGNQSSNFFDLAPVELEQYLGFIN